MMQIESTNTETFETRIQCIQKPDASAEKWRGLFNHGEKNEWLTLYRKDIDLLIMTGASSALLTATPTTPYTFTTLEQPVVELIETRGKFSLGRVSYNKSFISYEEGKVLVTQQQKAIQPDRTTLSYFNEQVDKAIAKQKSGRDQQRAADQTMLSPDDAAREDAEIFHEVFLHVDTLMDNFGKMQLAALWKYRQSGKYRALPNAPQSVHDAISDLQFHTRDYTLSLAYVVDRIFPEVEALAKTDKPFLNPSNNTPITVEHLIVTPGLIQKLTKSSEYYAQLIDREEKQKLLGAIVTQTVANVKALREAGSKITAAPLVPFKIEPIPNSPLSRITLDVTAAQQMAVMRALRPLVGDISS